MFHLLYLTFRYWVYWGSASCMIYCMGPITQTGRKLDYNEGYVIDEGAKGYQYKDCKYYMYHGNCLSIKGCIMVIVY